MARAVGSRSSVEIGKENPEVKRETQSNIFHTYGKEVSPFSPSKIKQEEREFVMDSEASMHMIRRKDLNCVDLEIVRTSRFSPTVITTNGEVQTHEEATVYVRLGVHRTHVTEPMSTLDFFSEFQKLEGSTLL